MHMRLSIASRRAMRRRRCGAGDAAPAMRCARCGARDAVSRLRLAVTPKAFANASPGLLQPWVTDDPTQLTTLKALATAPPPRVDIEPSLALSLALSNTECQTCQDGKRLSFNT